MLLDGASLSGFALGLALTNKTEIKDPEMSREELEERLEETRKDEMQKEVNILVNQIGKIDQPAG